jgi:hypothetical protein
LAGHDAIGTAALVLGVFLGSAVWWVALALAVSAFRARLGSAAQQRLAAGSSVFIGLLGLAAVLASLVA